MGVSLWVFMAAAGMHPSFAARLAEASPDEVFEVFVLMNPQPDWRYIQTLPTYKERVDYLRDLARVSQEGLRRALAQGKIQAQEATSYWAFNGFQMKITKAELEKVLARSDVFWVEPVPRYVLFRGVPSKDQPEVNKKIIPWGITKIRADQVWAQGYTGQGVVLGVLDSGFDTTHPALSGGKFIRLRDFTSDGNPVQDGIGHGTHVSGTMVGGDGPGPFNRDIGVAPDARVVGAKVFNNSGYAGNFQAAFQWIATLKADSGINIRAVNNSWGICHDYGFSLGHWNDVLLWWNLDILPVFSNGNADITCSGPAYGSVSVPAAYPTTVGVGATNNFDGLASFSQWGPAPNVNPVNNPQYWYEPGWNFLKPDISAPGVSVYSSIPGGSYASWDGTSMASPHVTGAVALILQANPNLTKYDLYMILTRSASQTVSCGDCSSYPNNQAGWGRLDVLAAIQMLQSPFLSADSVRFVYPGGDRWDPGEVLSIDVRLVNTGGDTAKAITGTLVVSYPGVSVTDNSGSWPNLAPGGSAFTSDGGFTVQASGSAPEGDVTFRLYLSFTDSQGNPMADTLTFTFPLGRPRYDVYDVNAGDLAVNFTSVGAFPSPVELGSAPGSGVGFAYLGDNLLYYGSFAVGTGFTYVVDRWYGSTAGSVNRDFNVKSGGKILEITPPVLGDFQIANQMTDSGHPSPRGLEVIQSAYTFNGNYGNIIFVQYALFNTGSTNLTNAYAGFFMDFDIDEFGLNSGGVDAGRKLAYMYNAVLTDFTDTAYAGVKVVGASLGAAGTTPVNVRNLSLLHNPTYVYNGTSELTKINFLNGTYSTPSPSNGNADYSLVVSIGPFNLTAGAADTLYATFAFLASNSLTGLQVAADTADALFSGFSPVVDVKELPVRLEGVHLAPRYVGGRVLLEVNLPASRNLRLEILDPVGRRVQTVFAGQLEAGLHRFPVDGLARGVYFLRASGDVQALRRFVVFR